MASSRSNPISAGRLGFVHYFKGVGDVWHERLLMCQVQASEWVILTPDGDLYSEDIKELGFVPTRVGSAPRTLEGAMLYRFPAFEELYTKDAWGDLFEEAVATADLERGLASDCSKDALEVGVLVRSIGMDQVSAGVKPLFTVGEVPPVESLAAVGTPPGLGPPVPRLGSRSDLGIEPIARGSETPRAGVRWILLEDVTEERRKGTEWFLTSSAVVMKDHGIDMVDGAPVFIKRVPVGERPLALYEGSGAVRPPKGPKIETGRPKGLAAFLAGQGPSPQDSTEVRDARVCEVYYDERGKRRRGYEDACMMLEEPTFEDWPVQGPRTTRWLSLFIKDHGGTPRGRTARFMLDARVPEGDRVKHEHQNLMEILEYAMVYDQVDVSALSSFELLARRVALLEEAYTANPKNPRLGGVGAFHRSGEAGGSSCTSSVPAYRLGVAVGGIHCQGA